MGWLCHTVNWFLVWVIGWYFELNHVSIHLDLLVEEHPFHQKVTLLLGEGGPNPLTFVLNANLLVNVKLITCKYCTFSFPLNPAFYFFFSVCKIALLWYVIFLKIPQKSAGASQQMDCMVWVRQKLSFCCSVCQMKMFSLVKYSNYFLTSIKMQWKVCHFNV